MSEITHQKARSLIQAAADQVLQPEEKIALDTHLAWCQACVNYATNLSALEVNLRKSFHTTWDNQHVPSLDLQAIINPSLKKFFWNNLFGQTSAMAKATIVAALLVGYFVIANLLGIQTPIVNEETATILPTPNEFASAYSASPTPSAPVSLTGATSQSCETVTYRVQKNDTLASIAYQHGTTKEAILEYNHLSSNMVPTDTELIIPFCNTPSHTATIPENMTTITPLNGTVFPTQPQ